MLETTFPTAFLKTVVNLLANSGNLIFTVSDKPEPFPFPELLRPLELLEPSESVPFSLGTAVSVIGWLVISPASWPTVLSP